LDDGRGNAPHAAASGERVGQKQVAVTLDVYTHVMPLDEIAKSAYLDLLAK
jgi:hypothetical protein